MVCLKDCVISKSFLSGIDYEDVAYTKACVTLVVSYTVSS